MLIKYHSKNKQNKIKKIKPKKRELILTKRTLPMASNPLSKRKTIPKNEKNMPNPVNPSPISVPIHN